MRALGVDVAVNGLDSVLLDDSRKVAGIWPRHSAERLRAIVEQTQADVVAIDSPPRFGRTGPRLAERELNVRGIKVFYSPTPEKRDDPFYEWMKAGCCSPQSRARRGGPR